MPRCLCRAWLWQRLLRCIRRCRCRIHVCILCEGCRKQQESGSLLCNCTAYSRARAGKAPHGERLHRNTDKAKRFMTAYLPITNIAEKYVIFAPLSKVKPYESPVFVVFVADPMQITRLVKLVGAIREGTDPVWVPPM